MLGTTQRAAYLYDGRSRLAKSVRANVANAGTSHYIHNADDQIIAELDGAGNTLREYIYMSDLPVAVVEGGTVGHRARLCAQPSPHAAPWEFRESMGNLRVCGRAGTLLTLMDC